MDSMKWSLIAASAAAITGVTLFGIDDGAHAGTSQTLISSNTFSIVPARLVSTELGDRWIINHCIESGGTKTDCVCFTKVLKYELFVGDYRNIANRVKPPENKIPPLAIDQVP